MPIWYDTRTLKLSEDKIDSTPSVSELTQDLAETFEVDTQLREQGWENNPDVANAKGEMNLRRPFNWKPEAGPGPTVADALEQITDFNDRLDRQWSLICKFEDEISDIKSKALNESESRLALSKRINELKVGTDADIKTLETEARSFNDRVNTQGVALVGIKNVVGNLKSVDIKEVQSDCKSYSERLRNLDIMVERLTEAEAERVVSKCSRCGGVGPDPEIPPGLEEPRTIRAKPDNVLSVKSSNRIWVAAISCAFVIGWLL